MNNAPTVDAAPWYFTAIVAGITATTALVTSVLTAWLTHKYADKRAKAELQHQRAQFKKQMKRQQSQFREQMDRQLELERRKLIFDRRSDIYVEIMGSMYVVMQLVSSVEVMSDEKHRDKAALLPQLGKVTETSDRLNELILKAQPIASGEVMHAMLAISSLTGQLGDALIRQIASLDNTETVGRIETTLMYREVQKHYSAASEAMRSDLGVLDKIPWVRYVPDPDSPGWHRVEMSNPLGQDDESAS
jgi:hypothetical protein